MKALTTGLTVLVILASIFQCVFGAIEKSGQGDLLRVYEVNKKVCDFPEGEDFSTPEAAYATINRLSASGDQGFWRRVSAKKVARRIPVKEGKREVSKTAVHEWVNATVIEVRTFQGKFAMVSAKVPHKWKTVIDTRSFELEDGRWRNAGNSAFGSVEEARKKFDILCGNRVGRPKREKSDNPEAYLRTYTGFLEENGQEPKEFVLDALKKHEVVIIGEIHHRPKYWAFNSSLVGDPEFAEHVGVIYLELPANHQKAIDKFLASNIYHKELVIEMLRDMLWMGWPDRPMLDFFEKVWQVNQNLDTNQDLRIVLVDMERPWEKIQKREDWGSYDVDRDKYMAENIIDDIKNTSQDKRKRLFIVGVGHTALNFGSYGGHPLKTAGWYLNEKLGEDKVCAIMQHRCVMTNMGRVDGRVCLGLFDSAFEALENRPVGFTLENGPFGEQLYDGQPDTPVWSKYRDGFNGYLYLGPLEDETFSPLIPGFYTDEFVKELERRYRLMFGKGWTEAYGQEKSDAISFINWMSGSWGQPRKWRNELGPIDAWKYGDDWENEIQKKKHKDAFKNPDVIKTAAKKLFDAIRNADYKRHYDGRNWQNFLPQSTDYQVHHHFPSWVQWVCKTFKNNPIEFVGLGEVSKGQYGLPAISYKLNLRDGRELEGTLPLRYMPRQNVWMGVQGIDWHLQYPEATKPKSEAKDRPVETKVIQNR